MKKEFEKVTGRLEKNMKVLNITHVDTDGSGAFVLLKSVCPNTDVIRASNNAMDNEIKKSLEVSDNYDAIVITDISCSVETAKAIEESGKADKYILLDHHKTAVALNDFSFAVVCLSNPEDSMFAGYYENLSNVKQDFFTSDGTIRGTASGTSLMADYLSDEGFELNETAVEFAHTVATYDTWDWVNLFDSDVKYDRLNCLYYAVGAERFEKSFINKIALNSFSLFDAFDVTILEIEDDKIASYLERKEKTFKEMRLPINGRTYSVAFVLGEQNFAQLFERMEERFPDTDIYVVDSGSGYSFRTRKPGIDVSAIAKELGGGGHTQASGCKYSFDLKTKQFERIVSSNGFKKKIFKMLGLI